MAAGIVFAENAYEALATGLPSMDRFGIRGRVLLYATLAGVDPRIIMGFIYKESKGEPQNYLGDTSAAGGPSVGPGQVYRATAKAYRLWAPPPGATDDEERAAYAELSDDEDWGIKASIQVFKRKLAEHGGDVKSAIVAYNGAGSRAVAYETSDENWLKTTYGADVIS